MTPNPAVNRRRSALRLRHAVVPAPVTLFVGRQVGERPSCMLLRCHAFAMRPSVKVGGGAISAMPTSPLIGSRGVSRVPLLPAPLGIGFPAQFRRVPLQGIAVASVGGQAGRKRVLRKLPPMPTPVYPACSWACCTTSSTLRPTRRSTGRRSALRLRHTVVPAPVT